MSENTAPIAQNGTATASVRQTVSYAPTPVDLRFTGQTCWSCGNVTQQAGTCQFCPTCGETSGCS